MFPENLIAREMPNHIPLDVIVTILSKLPIKDVVRFRAVSKSWNAAILNSSFARIHLNNARHYSDVDEDQLFVWPSRDSGVYHIGRFNDSSKFEVVSHVQCPLLNPSPLCSCDGFFLIYDTTSKIYVLWNPITQSKISFAYPETTDETTAHGICYDSWADDYKVVLVNNKSLLYTVFSCKKDSWTKAMRFPYSKVKRDPAVSVRGIPYWVVADTNRIAYFNAKDCTFKELTHMPNEVTETDLIRLTNLNGRLCLRRRGSHDNGYMSTWVLTEGNAWTKLKSSPAHPSSSMSTKLLLLTEDGDGVRLLNYLGHKSITVLSDEGRDRCMMVVGAVFDRMMDSPPVVSVRGSLSVLKN